MTIILISPLSQPHTEANMRNTLLRISIKLDQSDRCLVAICTNEPFPPWSIYIPIGFEYVLKRQMSHLPGIDQIRVTPTVIE